MRWGALRAWNDETLAPDSGFPPLLHTDVEIITCVRLGALTHEDDLGNRGRTRAGDVQVMSAGSGLTHAEFNMEGGPARAVQIWIEPDRRARAQLGQEDLCPRRLPRPFPDAGQRHRRRRGCVADP